MNRPLHELDAARVPMGQRTPEEQREAFSAAIAKLAPEMKRIGITIVEGTHEVTS